MTEQPSTRSHEPRQRLGRGLAALLGSPKIDAAQPEMSGVKQVPIEFIRTSVRNPRQDFNEADLEDLTASIRERGIIQPIIVRPLADASDAYEIVAGERRWRAAQRAEQHTVPVIVLQLNDRESLELSIIENVQRADLNALEEARGYSQLAAEFGYNHADIGRVVGKSRSHVANTLRLMALPESVRELLRAGSLTAGHARALLSVPNPEAIAEQVVTEGLTVRDVEGLNNSENATVPKAKSTRAVDPTTKDLVNRLSLALGAAVTIRSDKRKQEIRLSFNEFEQLEYVCNRLLQMEN
jgi:ParB family transcriptional regulator, chromosome partitioning protein